MIFSVVLNGFSQGLQSFSMLCICFSNADVKFCMCFILFPSSLGGQVILRKRVCFRFRVPVEWSRKLGKLQTVLDSYQRDSKTTLRFYAISIYGFACLLASGFFFFFFFFQTCTAGNHLIRKKPHMKFKLQHFGYNSCRRNTQLHVHDSTKLTTWKQVKVILQYSPLDRIKH